MARQRSKMQRLRSNGVMLLGGMAVLVMLTGHLTPVLGVAASSASETNAAQADDCGCCPAAQASPETPPAGATGDGEEDGCCPGGCTSACGRACCTNCYVFEPLDALVVEPCSLILTPVRDFLPSVPVADVFHPPRV